MKAPSTLCILISLVSSLCLSVRAQDAGSAKLTPPPRPYVGVLKGDYSLVEKIAHKSQPPGTPATPSDAQVSGAAAATPGPELVGFESIETGAVRKDKQIFADGTSSEIWRSNALRFILRPENPGELLVASYQMSNYVDPADFAELKWVGAGFYKGEQEMDDRKCYFYKQGDQSAWIDESTRWPVLYDSPKMRITYTYSTPDAALQLPANISKKVQQMRRAWAGLPPQ